MKWGGGERRERVLGMQFCFTHDGIKDGWLRVLSFLHSVASKAKAS